VRTVELIEQANLEDLNWGVRRPLRGMRAEPVSDEDARWRQIDILYPGLRPPDTQTLPACEAYATAGAIEWHYYEHSGERVVIDAEALYRRAREMFWDGSAGGGLLLGQSAEAAREMGVLPAGTQTARVEPDLGALLSALESGPLIQAHSVHDGWRPSQLNAANGAINELWPALPLLNGHATLLCGTNTHDDAGTGRVEHARLMVFQNSWGEDWGCNGLGAMTLAHWMQTAIDRPVALIIPANAAWTIPDEYTACYELAGEAC
jgi:hypothetical protein